jgi:S1-C subfamily serine protease
MGPGCKVNGVDITDIRLSENDFARFKGPESSVQARLTCRRYEAGDSYLAVGYAFGAPFLTSSPLIASAFDTDPEHTEFVGEVIPGMSGGAVMDTRGYVRGIVNKRWPARSIALADTPLCERT